MSVLSFLSPTKPYIQKVAGKPVNFYPISVGQLFSLSSVAEPLVKALTALFSMPRGDAEVVERSFDKGESRETILGASKVENLTWRAERMDKAISGLLRTLGEPKNQNTIAVLLMDSMRDEFKPENRNDWPPPGEFFSQIPVTILPDLLTGFLLANKDILGPLAQEAEVKVKERIKKAVEQPSPLDGPEPMPGDISGQPSSPSPATPASA